MAAPRQALAYLDVSGRGKQSGMMWPGGSVPLMKPGPHPAVQDSTCSEVSIALLQGSASLSARAVSATLSAAALLAALSKDGELRGEGWHDFLPAQCRKDFTGVRSRYTLSWSPSDLLSLLGTSSCKRRKFP